MRKDFKSPEDIFHFQLFLDRDMRGFAYIYKKLYPLLIKSKYKHCQPEEIEDLVHDEFVKIWIEKKAMNDFFHIFSHIKKTVDLNSLNLRKKQQRFQSFKSIETYNDLETEQIDSFPNLTTSSISLLSSDTLVPSSSYPDKEEKLRLTLQAIPFLDSKRKHLIESLLSGKSEKEIAVKLGLTINQLKKELQNCYNILLILIDKLKTAEQHRNTTTLPEHSFAFLKKVDVEIINSLYAQNSDLEEICVRLKISRFQLIQIHKKLIWILKTIQRN